MLLLLAELNARPAVAEEVAGILVKLAAHAQGEAGTLVYAVHRQQENRNAFLLYELYRDRAACDAHLASAPVQQALQRFDALLAGPPRIVFCDMVAAAGIG